MIPSPKRSTHRIERSILLPAVRALVGLGLGRANSTSFQTVFELVDQIASGDFSEDDFSALEDIVRIVKIASAELVDPFTGFEGASTVLSIEAS
jgi:hypothetical protein